MFQMVVVPLLILSMRVGRVTLTMAPTRVPVALPLLSAAVGQKLTASPAFEDEVMLARLKDASAGVALGHLAESLCAKWVKRPDGSLRLEPDDVALRKLEEAQADAKLKLILDSFTYYRKRLSEEPEELDEASVKAFKAEKATDEKRAAAAQRNGDEDRMWISYSSSELVPSWRAVAQIALLFDPKDLAAMPVGDHEVYAELPTRMQHAFPDGSDSILERYRREVALWSPNLAVARVKVTVQNEYGEVWMTFTARDRSGKPVDRQVIGLEGGQQWRKTPPSQRPGFAAGPDEKPIDTPEAAVEARIALCNESLYRKPDKIDFLAKLLPKMMNPERFEPTQWHTGQDFISAAEGVGKNLIGTIGDNISARFWPVPAGILKDRFTKPSQILGRHRPDFLPESDGWLVVRSAEPAFRCSRGKAKEFLQQAERLGGVTVDSAANWVAQTPEPKPFYLWLGDYLNALYPSANQMLLDDDELRLWASLGSGAMDSLRRGDKLRLSALVPEVQTQIFRLVYWYMDLDGDRGDPTEKMPNGISDGTMSLSVWEMPIIHAWSSKTGPQLPMHDYWIQNIGRSYAAGEGWFHSFDRFQVGVRRTYTLSIVLSPGQVPMTIDLPEVLFDPDTPVLTELPANLSAEIQKERQEAILHPSNGKEIDGPMPVIRGKQVFPPPI